ncbi:sirohydrochlorin chelatase [Paraburkholderia sp. DD10]|jgi:sirohydrochlorin cobaltochelatase|uniref:Sirohydrochlorin cobaltochelatase n=1 Tax=Paraburkholderia terricola TaxID=169427 RepID=A0ABU1LLU2_9BURK|nr:MULTISPECIES: CbiX/SirB N-terminal domain-containing protein [Paraburkholderia]ORC46684.1 cobalamin biosynthesis protein CbiX [Burkholderia sp. A27]AXE91557.1 cobalamin biosynthesis protein CbiX [Paraburkholderia terricola]MDR6407505.1 sirohydrochlorin cobaltochelatase [Paraburkholderia terricola]MDR6445428.1 sirohydrochlorin cobaltochelatase [Paraburkholderia terricola]MDR6480280.1 sirohydrochlorin cobaltochelatase [Paraburkholderia terricola]
MATHGMVLFAHGARDVRWREPFERLADKLRAARASRGEAGPVLLAFLELMEPDLPTAVGVLVADGCSVVTVVPVFFGQGGHVRRDLPAVVERCRGLFPSAEIRCAVAVGEDDLVLDAVAEYCLRQV